MHPYNAIAHVRAATERKTNLAGVNVLIILSAPFFIDCGPLAPSSAITSCQRPALAQRLYLQFVVAGRTQDGIRVSTRRTCGPRGRRPRTTEARRWRGLRDAGDFDECAARLVVRMLRGLTHGKYRRETDICSLHDLAPFVARFLLDNGGQPLFQGGPLRGIHVARELFRVYAR